MVTKKTPVNFSYVQYEKKGTLPSKCVYQIKYNSENTPPKRNTEAVSNLCRIECEWDKPFEEWTPVGTMGYRKHDDLNLAMRFEGEAIWKVRVGSKQQEHDVNVEYSY